MRPAEDMLQYLELAEVCAQKTVCTLWPTGIQREDPGQRERFEQFLIQVKILFLFPQWPDWQRGLLATLYWQRQALTRLLNQSAQNRPVALRRQAEQLTRQLEYSFLNLVGQIRSLGGYTALSPMQRDVLEREFLRVEIHAPAE